MSLCAGHQPNFCPYGGFFAKMSAVDVFVIVDNVQYVKKEYHNRNKIKLNNGQSSWLSIPVKNKNHYQQKINEAEIDYSYDWTKKLLKTIELSYKKSTYFHDIFPFLSKIFLKKQTYLFDLNLEIILAIKNYLKISTTIHIASDIQVNGKASQLIINLCKKAQCDSYLHGVHALDYVEFQLLEKSHIQSFIQNFHSCQYPQGDSFIENLSVIDILFHCGEKTLSIINSSNTIREHKST